MASHGAENSASCEDLSDVGNTDGNTRPHLRVLPPAANWYCSQVCDWGYDARNARWLILYGAKNGICIYEFHMADPIATPTKPQSPHDFDEMLRRPLRTHFVALLPRGKKDGRVTALRCLRDADGEMRVVCTGEEGAVQLWDPMTLARVDQHRKHNTTEVTAVGVRSELDPNWIVAGDRQGVLSLWQRDSATVHTFSPLPRDSIFSMDVAPFDKRLVAVGYRSGALCVVDVIEKNIRYRLDGHDLEVQSSVWASRMTTSSTPPVDYLATASRDRSIKVWTFPHKDTEEEGDQEPYLAARLEVRKPQQASSHSQSTRLWLPLAWTYDLSGGCKYGLWTGSFEGNLQLFQWKGAPSGTIKPSSIIKNGHNRLLFGIVSLRASNSVPASGGSTENQLPSLIATISLDRDLRVWNEELAAKATSVMTCVERIPAQGGFTYSLDFNPSRKMLACGVGDQTIRVWNLSAKPSAGGYQTELVWKGLQSKVTSVCWHPMQDHLLAFGTEDGRVGLWNSRSKSTQRLKVKHSSEIHLLQWTVHTEVPTVSDDGGGSSFQAAMKALEQAQVEGHSLEDVMAQQQDRLGQQRSSGDVAVLLWTCDRAGLLCQIDTDKDASIQIRKDCGAFAWDASNSMLAIGLSSGKVDILTYHDTKFNTKNDAGLSSHMSIFEHKENVAALSWSNAYASSGSLLASGTKSGEIIVCEGVKANLNSSRRFSQLPGYGENVVAVFKAHSGVVNCLRWSSSLENCLLASCGDDGAVKVWDISYRTLRSSFTLHANRVFSVAWITSTVLSSCGQDQSIRLWNYEDHTASLDKTNPVQAPSSNAPRVKVQAQDTPVARSETTDTVEHLTKKPSPKSHRRKKTLEGESLFSMEDTTWMLMPQSPTADISGNTENARDTIRNGIASRRKLLEQDGKIEEAAQLYLLEGRIAEALRLLASHNMLTAAWVSYAPMAGQEVWREISILYANQLKDSGDYKCVALQYLIVGHVESAVDAFVEGELYREAIALILSRLGASHPLLKTTTWQYAVALEKKKKIDEAASAYLSINASEANLRAITILASSGNIEHGRRAMSVWTALSKTVSSDAVSDRDNDSVVPSSVFVAICNHALAHHDFRLASQAIAGLVHNQQSLRTAATAPSSQPEKLYMLSLITLGIASVLRTGKSGLCATDSAIIQDTSGTTREAAQFIKLLQSSHSVSWLSLLDTQAPVTEPSSDSSSFWVNVLTACRENGLWFDESLLTPDEVVEQLSDATVFNFMVSSSQPSNQKRADEITRLRELIDFSRLVLKLLAELMSGYLLSALEVLRDLFSTLISSQHDQLRILQLLFPGGMLDPASPPLFGELADEETDTRALWADCCFLQCEAVLHYLREEVKKDDTTELRIDQLSKHAMMILQLPELPEATYSRAYNLQHEIDAYLPSAAGATENETDEANGELASTIHDLQ